MANIRIYELSKETGEESAKIIEILKKKGISATTSSSTVSEEDAAYVKRVLSGEEKKPEGARRRRPQIKMIMTKNGPIYLNEEGKRVRPPHRRKPAPKPGLKAGEDSSAAENKGKEASAAQESPANGKDASSPAKTAQEAADKSAGTSAAETPEQAGKAAGTPEQTEKAAEAGVKASDVSADGAAAALADQNAQQSPQDGANESGGTTKNGEKSEDEKGISNVTAEGAPGGDGTGKKAGAETAAAAAAGERHVGLGNRRPRTDGTFSEAPASGEAHADGSRRQGHSEHAGGSFGQRGQRQRTSLGDRRPRTDGTFSSERTGTGRGTDGARRDSRAGGGRGTDGSADRTGRGSGGFGSDRTGARRPADGRPGTAGRYKQAPAAAGPSTDKDRRSRSDKLKQDRRDKSRKYRDGEGQKGGRDGKSSKNMLQRSEQKKHKQEQKAEEIKVITIPETITIAQLAEKMKMQPAAIIKKLFLEGKAVTINTDIDFETAEAIALDYEIMCEKEEPVDVIAELLKEEDDDESKMKKRPPIVCVMGHVDHGKTSLLDAIRNTNVISGEAGGITQHIGAYVVSINGENITFLDTPGHEAFTSMRMRGAQSTDIAVLVVAADDGVMPQTIEAINHAKAAGVEIIVAINKMDKPGANPDKVKKELADHELLTEDWGGDVVCVPVSAKTGEGISDLLEMIILQSEVLELRANPDRLARGIVIEAKLDKNRGPVATVLVQKGTLKSGDHIAAGSTHGRVRAMIDDQGRVVKTAGPAVPVEILGLDSTPEAGDVFVAKKTTNEAREFAETFIAQKKAKLLEGTKLKLSLDDLYSQIQSGEVKELNLIIKADVQGSVEAVKQSLEKLSNEEVAIRTIHGGAGAINESDIILASASNAIVIGFNVPIDPRAKATAAEENIDVRLYSVIYNAIDDIEAAMKGMLDPVYEEETVGHGEIRQTFKSSGVGVIAGSYVLDGVIARDCSVKITRDGEQIFDGAISSLKRFQDDVKEVKTGFECGIVFDKFTDLKEGDQIEAYRMVEVPR